MYFTIFYKKLKIDWVLCEFHEPTVTMLIEKILKKTKNTKIISYGNLLCKSKKDLDIIYKILKDKYHEIIKQKKAECDNLPNLLIESIKLFLKDED